MKKRLALALTAALLLSVPAYASPAEPDTSAKAMIVYHAGSGAVLAEINADEPMLIASTTKLMTALTALELASPERTITVLPEWTAVEGSSMYLRAGETYTLRELLEGLLLASGNDAALAIASSLGGEKFMERMNRKADELGLTAAHFVNPHGLDAPEHHASARDLAVIMTAALQNGTLAEILSLRSSCIHGVTYVNHNKLLWSCRGVTGGKTGYTKAAGRCLVTSCERNGLRLICVTLNDANDWKDHAALYDWAFETYAPFTLSEGKTIERVPVIGGTAGESIAVLDRTVSLCLPKSAEVSLRVCLPRFVFAPVAANAPAGRLIVLADGTEVFAAPLRWAADNPLARRSGIRIKKEDQI